MAAGMRPVPLRAIVDGPLRQFRPKIDSGARFSHRCVRDCRGTDSASTTTSRPAIRLAERPTAATDAARRPRDRDRSSARPAVACRILAAARLALGAAAEATLLAGEALEREALIAYVRQPHEPESLPLSVPTPLPIALALTRRERELLPYLAQGFANKRIAAELHIGTRTVEMHVTNLLGKVAFENCVQFAAWAVAHEHVATAN